MKIDGSYLAWVPAVFLVSSAFCAEDPPRPLLMKSPPPPYTEEGREARAEGSVVLQAVVTGEGKIRDIRVTKSLGYGLDESAMRTVGEKWKFEPAIRDGQPIDSTVTIEIVFRLLDGSSPLDQRPPEPPVDIYSVKFQGNKAVTENQLKALLREKLGGLGIINRNDVERVIREYYENRGNVKTTLEWKEDALHVNEGKQYRMGNLEIKEALVFPTDYLLSLLEIKKGDVLDMSKIRNGLEKIRQLYSSARIYNWSYIPEQTINETEGTVDVKFTFEEREQ